MGVCLAEMEGKHSRCTRKGTLVHNTNSWASGRICRPACSREKSVRQTGYQENRVPVPALLVRICMTMDKSRPPSPSLLPLGLSFLICVMGTGLLYPQSPSSLEALRHPSSILLVYTGAGTL